VTADIASPQSVVAFWTDAGPKKWFTKDDAFDHDIRARFLATHEAAAQGKLGDWEASAEGVLALLILLDQFPRNMFRGSARTFATDPLARDVAHRALKKSFDADVPEAMRNFFYLPFQHSEQLADQERSLALYRAWGDVDNIKWADIHADIIRKFGRFPHRNAVLGRETTPEEQAFLDGGGFKG
jgi:uncharacterized protein (DUF924 family)